MIGLHGGFVVVDRGAGGFGCVLIGPLRREGACQAGPMT
jgi:hypothetical protein